LEGGTVRSGAAEEGGAGRTVAEARREAWGDCAEKTLDRSSGLSVERLRGVFASARSAASGMGKDAFTVRL
jgi:hypothetical protein